jgi:hypothetical protein
MSRAAVLDEQLDLLAGAVEGAVDDERDVARAPHADREGIGAAVARR